MKLLYITSAFPFGVGEGFLVSEIEALARLENEIVVAPLRRPRRILHGDAQSLSVHVEAEPLLSPRVLAGALRELARRPGASARALGDLFASRNARILAKNLAAFPKALWLARRARTLGVQHVHVHWAATTATLALVVGRLTGITWSLTTHRWDIAEDNLLAVKLRRASYVRAINVLGAQELARRSENGALEPEVLHMGVDVPPHAPAAESLPGPFRILTAASLLEVKGHVHLAEALALLVARGRRVEWDVAGDGPVRSLLAERIAALGLEPNVRLLGFVPHDELLRGMRAAQWTAVVLPSIETDSGVREGIPVSLIEAMAHGLPVVATDTGGIPELLHDGAGIVVPQRDPAALAEALERLIADVGLRRELCCRGRERVEREFSATAVAACLHERFQMHGPEEA
jgi:colanic acid/amylovoran biosynthesis glycosyltransferase